jgi:heptosyltransferase-3
MRAALPVALAAFGFFLPFSSAGIALALGALLCLALARPRSLLVLQPWKDPVMAVGLALFAYIALHTLWTAGLSSTAVRSVNRYHELLVAPLLMALLARAPERLIFVRALVAGAVLLAVAHWLALAVPAVSAMVAMRRISAGLAIALCAFIVLMRARGQPRPWPARALAAFLALTVLFAIDGRTGHLVLLILVACAAWCHSPPRWRLAGALACTGIVVAMALGSGPVGGRLKETLAGSTHTGPLTSTAIRIELLKVSADLAREHGITGVGYANYAAMHEQAAQARYGQDPSIASNLLAAPWLRAANPHNEYLMQLIGGGITALALFVAWLLLTLRQAARAPSPVGGMLAGTALAFAAGSLFNSLLMDFVEAHLYVGVLAWLLAEKRYGAGAAVHNDGGVQRIVVIATRQIGDVLLTTPLISAARRRWPQARIEVLGFQGTLGMLRGNPEVDELVETPARLGMRSGVALLRRLWRRYDLALVTDPGDRAHLLGWIAAPLRSGVIPESGGTNWLKKRLLHHALPVAGDRGSVHVTVEKQALLSPWTGDEAGTPPRVVPPEGRPLPADVQAQLMPGVVVVHAPSMWPYKQWPIQHFGKLIEGLMAQGRQVVLTGSAGPRDQECIAPLRGLGSSAELLDLSGKLDFNQLVTLFRQAALYIGPDTSVSHLAAATGVPVIAIFGPTNPMRWAPWPASAKAQALFARSALVQQTGNVTLLQSGLHCVPCGRAGCEDHRQSRSDCLVDITPERVLEQAAKVLRPVRLASAGAS